MEFPFDSPSHSPLGRRFGWVVLGWVVLEGAVVAQDAAPASLVIGAEECIECHRTETRAWQETAHYHSRDLHQHPEALKIAQKMGIASAARIQMSGLCTQCHFTVQQVAPHPAMAIGGVSCESCHGGALKWVDVHNTGDRREAKDTVAARAARTKEAAAQGLAGPDQIHRIAANCYGCHIVTDEALVNQGGHPPGSDLFELVSWLKGEVRHNVFDSKGNANDPIPAERQRVIYVVGKALEMEQSLRGLARATERADFGNAMGRRCVSARQSIDEIIAALGDDVPAELKEIQAAIGVPGLLRFFNVEPLTAAADAINDAVARFVATQDGSRLAAIDPLIPKEGVGTVFQP